METDDTEDSESGPHLYVVGTPIGNLGDVTHRALEVLRKVEAIAAEDTRRTLKLLSAFDIRRPSFFFSCNDHNERGVVERVLGLLRAGHTVALCSDAGMPLVSDPGYVVLREVRAAGFGIEIVPGPSAATTAIVASGLPVHAWTFKGFPPRKPGKRKRFLEQELNSPHTLVLFEAAPRVPTLLRVAAEVLGDRPAAVCIELTKRYEQVERGTLSELAERFATKPPRGEVTVVIGGREDE